MQPTNSLTATQIPLVKISGLKTVLAKNIPTREGLKYSGMAGRLTGQSTFLIETIKQKLSFDYQVR